MFDSARFVGTVSFGAAVFEDRADFAKARFAASSTFQRTKFNGVTNFTLAVLAGHVRFREAEFNDVVYFSEAALGDWTSFELTRFGGHAIFYRALIKVGRFEGARVEGDLIFYQTAIADYFRLNLEVSDSGHLYLHQISRAPFQDDLGGVRVPPDAPEVHLLSTSLERATFRSLRADHLHLRYAGDIDRVRLHDVNWPTTKFGWHTADESELERWELSGPRNEGHLRRPPPNGYLGTEKPTHEEVTRIHRALRKNHDDSADRIGAHRWYYSEMELLRRYTKLFSFPRLARAFYKSASRYGFSAVRPLVWIVLLLFASGILLGSSWKGVCVERVLDKRVSCVADVGVGVRVAISAATFRDPPPNIEARGAGPLLIWGTTRVSAAAFLLTLGLAFRNQVAR